MRVPFGSILGWMGFSQYKHDLAPAITLARSCIERTGEQVYNQLAWLARWKSKQITHDGDQPLADANLNLL